MEVYVDDMLVKSLKKADHITHLQEAFEVLRIWEVFSIGGLKREIEAVTDKIKAIFDMEPPSSVKDVQKLTSRITVLGRFISKSEDKCLSFFKALKKVKDFAWTDESQTSL
ncbi:uncharacterized protein LOC141690683 [Apium graveolens]|uniref:uncharacterized protein LOC141690683 n=1 Tax=Apium graveolens TaxID=4045 RepID=UPI003D7976F3